MTLQKQNSNTMPSCFKQNKPLISRQPLNKNEIKNDFSQINIIKSNSKSDNEMAKKELKLCSQIWMKISKLPLIKYLEKKHNPNVHLDTKVLNEITHIYEKVNKEEYSGKDEFYSLVMDIINKFGLICKPSAQVYPDYNNLKLIFNTEWTKSLNILKLNKDSLTTPNTKANKITCNICKEEFKSKKDYKIHIKSCLINCQKPTIKEEGNNKSNNKVIIPSTSLSSPPPGIKYKYEKKDILKSEKKELSISYKYYSKFFKPEFNMESIKINDSIECPFINCTVSSPSIAKLVTHIMTNHQDRLTVISDYYCSVCGKRLTDIVTQIIHNVEHQYNKRRKIFSKDHSSTSSSLINPLSSISNSYIPINSSLSKPSSLSLSLNNSNKSLNSKSAKLKRKYPFDSINTNVNSVNISSKLDTNNNKTKNQESNKNFPLTPSPTSSLSQILQNSPSKFNSSILTKESNEEQSKENSNILLNSNSNIKEQSKVKKIKTDAVSKTIENSNISLENSLDKSKKIIPEKVQLQLGQTSDNILQLKISNNKIISNKALDEGKSLNNLPSPISSPVINKISSSYSKDNMILSSPVHSHKNSSSTTVSYTRSKLRIPCVVETCKKTYKNIKGLKTHISRYHPEVHVNIEELVEQYKIQSEQEELKKSKKVKNILPITSTSNLNLNLSINSNININSDTLNNTHNNSSNSNNNNNVNSNENDNNNQSNIINNNKTENSDNNNNNNNNNNNLTSSSNLLSIGNNPLLNIPSDSFNIDKSLSPNTLNSFIKGKVITNDSEVNEKEKLNSFDTSSLNIDSTLVNNLNSKPLISDLNNMNLLQDYLINNNILNNNELGNLNLNTPNPFAYVNPDLTMPINLQNSLLFNNSLSKNTADLLKNPSLLSDLNKPDLLSNLSSQVSTNNDLLSNNLLLNFLCNNNMNNQTLPLNNNINDLNMLNMSYNLMNPFSLYGLNQDNINSLNNTQLQQLLLNNTNNNDNNNHINDSNINSSLSSSNHNSNNNDKDSKNNSGDDQNNKKNDVKRKNENENNSEQHHDEKSGLLNHINIIENDSNIKPTTAEGASSIKDNPVDKLNVENPSGPSSLETDFLNNIYMDNNLSHSNLDLLNLTPSTSDSKSLDLLSNSLVSDLKDIDLKPDDNIKTNEK